MQRSVIANSTFLKSSGINFTLRQLLLPRKIPREARCVWFIFKTFLVIVSDSYLGNQDKQERKQAPLTDVGVVSHP